MNELLKRFLKLIWVLVYFPISFSLIGILAYLARLKSPSANSYAFRDVFNTYANPLQPSFIGIHLPALIFTFTFLVLLVSIASERMPLFTLFQIRLILLMLLGVITILVKIFLTVLVYAPFRPLDFKEFIYIPIFLYIDVHILLLYLLTYLPKFRKLNTTLI